MSKILIISILKLTLPKLFLLDSSCTHHNSNNRIGLSLMNQVYEVHVTKFLGVIIDRRLAWTNYIGVAWSKLSWEIYVLRALSEICPDPSHAFGVLSVLTCRIELFYIVVPNILILRTPSLTSRWIKWSIIFSRIIKSNTEPKAFKPRLKRSLISELSYSVWVFLSHN